MSSYVVFIGLLFITACYSAIADPVKFSSELELLTQQEIRKFLDSLPTQETFEAQSPVKTRLVSSFHYENCAKPSDEVVVVSSLSIKPDPLELPGNITVSFDSVIKAKFGSPLKAKLTVYKEIFGVYVEIPCVDNIGSCTYDKICAKLNKKIKTCPPQLVKKGINCRCPFSKTEASLNNFTFPLNLKVPSVVTGGVRVKIELMSGSTFITCMEITMEFA